MSDSDLWKVSLTYRTNEPRHLSAVVPYWHGRHLAWENRKDKMADYYSSTEQKRNA